jgi:Spy/CpxP family protein refolding chaperone
MTKIKLMGAVLVLAAAGGLTLVTAGPTSAMPGWGDGHAGMSITQEQREQIRNLHSAYRAALSNLDWSVDENGHSSETMQQARELRIALRAEIMDVLNRGKQPAASTPEGTCPYSGETQPVRLESNANTLYL